MIDAADFEISVEDALKRKKRWALNLGVAAAGGVTAGLLLKFYAGLAVVTAAVPPLAVFTLPLAVAVGVGVLTFVAFRAAGASANKYVEAENQAAQAEEENMSRGGSFSVGGVMSKVPNCSVRLGAKLYGEKCQPFWKGIFSWAKVKSKNSNIEIVPQP